MPTLDASATVVKADGFIGPKFHKSLQQAFTKLILDHSQSGPPDWHPGTGGKVLNLVHPSMYPLVYGRSRGIQQEVIGVEDAISVWAGKGEVINPDMNEEGQSESVDRITWSQRFQWLPSNFAVLDHKSVECESYINNLHPTKYKPIYRMIEKLIGKALPLWDQCLVQYQRDARIGGGRVDSRFEPPPYAR